MYTQFDSVTAHKNSVRDTINFRQSIGGCGLWRELGWLSWLLHQLALRVTTAFVFIGAFHVLYHVKFIALTTAA